MKEKEEVSRKNEILKFFFGKKSQLFFDFFLENSKNDEIVRNSSTLVIGSMPRVTKTRKKGSSVFIVLVA